MVTRGSGPRALLPVVATGVLLSSLCGCVAPVEDPAVPRTGEVAWQGRWASDAVPLLGGRAVLIAPKALPFDERFELRAFIYYPRYLFYQPGDVQRVDLRGFITSDGELLFEPAVDVLTGQPVRYRTAKGEPGRAVEIEGQMNMDRWRESGRLSLCGWWQLDGWVDSGTIRFDCNPSSLPWADEPAEDEQAWEGSFESEVATLGGTVRIIAPVAIEADVPFDARGFLEISAFSLYQRGDRHRLLLTGTVDDTGRLTLEPRMSDITGQPITTMSRDGRRSAIVEIEGQVEFVSECCAVDSIVGTWDKFDEPSAEGTLILHRAGASATN